MLQLMESIMSGAPEGYEAPENTLIKTRRALYISGEESVFQLSFLAARLGLTHVEICNETDIDTIADYANDYDLIIVDSFPCLTHTEKMSTKQLSSYAVNSLTSAAKETNCIIGFIMHMTKDGKLKGDTSVPHTVDMTMFVDRADEEVYGKDVRCIYTEKNRFGRTGEVMFRMTNKGYDLENPVEEVAEDNTMSHKLFIAALKLADSVFVNRSHLETIANETGMTMRKIMGMLDALEANETLTAMGRGQSKVWMWN
jgi:hypothetical protein